MQKTLLPQITPEQCEQITGTTRNHPAHTVFSKLTYLGETTYHPVGQCPGKHDHVQIAPPADPFAGIPGAHGEE